MADLRIQRTKRATHMALEQLLLNKEYHKLKIKDLVDAALTNRNTFYLHYRSLNDVLAEVVNEILERQSKNIDAQQFAQQPFTVFYQLWSNLTPTEHQILQFQQADPGFKDLLVRLVMQFILVKYPDDSAVWFAFGKVTAIIAWMAAHDHNWQIAKDTQQLQTMYDQRKLV